MNTKVIGLTREDLERIERDGAIVKPVKFVVEEHDISDGLLSVFNDFANAHLDTDVPTGHSVPALAVYRCYIKWAMGAGMVPMGKLKFYRMVSALEGVYKKPGGGNSRKFYNLGLIE